MSSQGTSLDGAPTYSLAQTVRSTAHPVVATKVSLPDKVARAPLLYASSGTHFLITRPNGTKAWATIDATAGNAAAGDIVIREV